MKMNQTIVILMLFMCGCTNIEVSGEGHSVKVDSYTKVPVMSNLVNANQDIEENNQNQETEE